jgi:SAM-dependent methyltransferase
MREERNMEGAIEIRDTVREKYGAIAEGCGPGSSCCGPEASCCGGATGTLERLGYTSEQAAAIPEGANLGLGCGNPLGHAAVQPGETVLDLGSGAGIDAFLAAREVGPEGRVIGVDMTASMLSRARANSEKGGFTNVEFRLGEIESLPVADATVDVIISNCVISLSTEKARVFAEARRVLKPGGRMVVSDLVLVRPLPESVRTSMEAYVGCVAGAWMKDDYLDLMRKAGFEDVAVLQEVSYATAGEGLPGVVAEANAWDAVHSVKVFARKPAA